MAILNATSALDVGVVWIPLLAAGVASLQPADSFSALLDSICRWNQTMAGQRKARDLTIVAVIYQERLLPRNEVAQRWTRFSAATSTGSGGGHSTN